MYIVIYNQEEFGLLRSTIFVVYYISFYDIIVLHYIIQG